jgi:uncharacterized membrane protein
MTNTGWWRFLALCGYLGTLFFILLWVIVLAPPATPKSIVLAIALLPLLPALRGLLHGRIYTYQWASFLALPYFAFGVDALVHRPDKNWLGGVLVILSLMWFVGCSFTARQHKKLSQKQSTASETES